ncbi:hypothetical protein PV569_34100 [Streptomyces scabiei]|uniref:hypothetical protein n=1 Tax=Streptomyces scabiei TaxID=1930 RepID=UPI0029B23EBD|nr:hypothetical protein [Streptomyces scabiei]MDX3298698.1 hypothetical protein [Streptomyces scabiei]
MSTHLDVNLTPDQHNLLATIARTWLDRGEWPVWEFIQHHFDQRNVDADEVFHSLPRVGADVPYAAGYGFTVPMRAPINPGDQVRLTVASSLLLPEMKMMAGDPFVRALGHMAMLYVSTPVPTGGARRELLRSDDLAEAPLGLKPWFIKRLPDLLSYEPTISASGATFADGSWEREINRSLRPYRGVRSVGEYVDTTCEIVAATAAQFAPSAQGGVQVAGDVTVAVVPEPERDSPYIALILLDDLEKAAATTRWKLHKLLALCRELNDNYAARNPYACAALIRAILDHIPRVFGHADYKDLVNKHTFAMKQTDGQHARKLLDFKDIAHDALHRQIGTSVPVLDMHDLPAPMRLNAILHELLTLL